jgi:hypothetical protein
MAEAIVVIGDQQFEADALKMAAGGDEFYLLRFVGDVAEELAKWMRLLAPHRSGRLAAEGIGHETEPPIGNIARAFAGVKDKPEYAEMVAKGTGIFGESHTNIRPMTGNVLAWTGANGKTIFARTVKGQRPHPFVQNATLIVEETYVRARLRLLGHEIAG